MSATTAMITDEAIKAGTKSVVNDVYGYLKGKVAKFAKLKSAKAHADHLFGELYEVLMVKTLLWTEGATNLLTFYHPTTLRPVHGREFVASCLDDFESSKGVLVQGLAGQGKSIFLRYLAAATLEQGRAIPIFFELRKIRDRTIEKIIEDELGALGFKADKDVVKAFCGSGKIVLLLDAFDECPEDRRQDIVEELETLQRNFKYFWILVTSRPGGGIETSSYFDHYKVSKLKKDGYKSVTKRIILNKEEHDVLAIKVDSVPGLVEILDTPLMVTLLVIHFWHNRDVPNSVVAFYNDLFDVLVRRHNMVEDGPKHKPKSVLDYRELRLFFGALCFQCRKEPGNDDRLRSHLEDLGAKAAHLASLECKVSVAIDDVIRITNLIVEEGGYCCFLHKSVIEFHAASFLARPDQPNDIGIEAFYRSMYDQPTKWNAWSGELYYLSLIDEYRFKKFFVVPGLQSVINAGISSSFLDLLTFALVTTDDAAYLYLSSSSVGGVGILGATLGPLKKEIPMEEALLLKGPQAYSNQQGALHTVLETSADPGYTKELLYNLCDGSIEELFADLRDYLNYTKGSIEEQEQKRSAFEV